ncbi:MAG: carboxyl transferase [Eubacterium sp.]|nr:carboxyl transferase [Eubacterium sp.]
MSDLEKSNALARLEALFDDGEFTQIDAFAKSADKDVEVVAGFGSVNGSAAYAFSQDITVSDGAVSVAQCAKIKKIYDLAAKTGCPVIGIYDSNGVKLTEGFEVLNAYGELVKASASISGVCPQLSLVLGSCLGTSALIASLADVIIAVKDADFYVSAPSDIKAEASYKEGTVDILCDDDKSAIESARDLIALMPSNNLSPSPVFDFAQPQSVASAGADAMSIINAVADDASVVELKGGYASSNCKTALATVMGSTVGFIAFDGSAVCPACAYKAEAMVKLCDAYSIPVITLVNADGIIKEKENQTLVALTKLTSAFATATCPKISVITGNAVGVSYIVLAGKGANADLTIAWESAVASPIDTDAAVAFLFNDRLANGENREALKKEYVDTIASPFTAAACGAVDDICAPEDTRARVISALDMLAGKRENTLPRKHSVK